MTRIFGASVKAAVAVAVVAATSYGAEGESAVREVRKDIEKLGLVEEFNPATEEIVGVGSVFSPVDVSARGWEEKFVEMVTTARAKAAMEVSKVLSANLSAARAVESASREHSRYKANARVIRMRTEGSPVGCRVISRRQKISQGKIEVAVALKWSVKLEEDTLRTFINPQAIEDEELEKWAEGRDFVSLVGPYFWTDGKDKSCFMGIGASEVVGDGVLAMKTAMRLANVRARRYVTYSFLEMLAGQEDVAKKSFRKNTDDETVAVVKSDYSFSIGNHAKGVMLPGMTQIYSTTSAVSPFTGKRMCVCVYAVSSAQAKGEIEKKIIEE